MSCVFFFFNDTATTEIYTLSLHDALPICSAASARPTRTPPSRAASTWRSARPTSAPGPPTSTSATTPRPRSTSTPRSEEHTSELQSRQYLVCRLLLEKKKHNLCHRIYNNL